MPAEHWHPAGVDDLQQLRALSVKPSVRTFEPEPVPSHLVERIVDVARWTGSARNRQPWRFLAVNDRPTLARIGSLGAYAQHVASAPCALMLLSADNGFRDTEFDLGRVAQSVALAASALGLGACLASIYPDENVAVAARVLGVDTGWLPRHALSIGYPAAPRVGKRAVHGGRHDVTELLRFHQP